jgi:uncharacterized protein (DUF2237 family)
MTGFYRDGYCRTGTEDRGLHTVCVQVTEDFLAFSKARGNDLSTPVPEHDFQGLRDGSTWCLCATRYKEALDAGYEMPIKLASTHEKTLEYVSLEQMKKSAIDVS